MAEAVATNGTRTPEKPHISSLSLTEYTATPSPSATPKQKIEAAGVPEHFLLPTGYPDVR